MSPVASPIIRAPNKPVATATASANFVNPGARISILIPASHPSLPGHFPNRPVVPGAVILTEIAAAAQSLLGADAHVTGIPSAKFITPLLPEQRCELVLTDNNAGSITFDLTHNDQRVASGNLRYQRASTTP